MAVKQILLGHDAKEDELNVVQVETLSKGNSKTIPIAVLKRGESQSMTPNLEFHSYFANFELIKGSGPVHITGLQFPDVFDEGAREEDDYEEESSYDEAEEDGGDGDKEKPGQSK